jgi:hypothetical protein
MQETLVELIISGAIFYTLYSIIKLFVPVKKSNSCGCSTFCSKFDSS